MNNLSRRTLFKYKRLYSYLFIGPSLLLILAITIYPLIYTLRLSFTNWEVIVPNPKFIGLMNYIQLITKDHRFIHGILLTVFIVAAEISIEFIMGFILASMLWDDLPGKKVFVAVLILPVLIMPVVSGYTWRLLLDAQYGPINQIIGIILGRSFTFTWLAQTNTAIFSIIVALVWQWTPFMAIVLLAGLTALPTEYFDAASVDGANYWQQFRWVTIPMLRPVIIVALLIRTLDAYKIFDIIYTLTGGSPGTSTESISLYIYKEAYRYMRLGYGAAASFLILIVIVISINIIQKYLQTE